MRSTLRNSGIILSCSLLALFCACGKGGGSTPTKGLTTNTPPTTTAPAIQGAPSSVVEYQIYTFTTTAADPNIGGTLKSCTWTFSDGYTVTTTTAPYSVTHAFLTSGTQTVSVLATDSTNVSGTAATQTFTVASAPNPFTLAVTTSSTSVKVAQTGTATATFSFSVDYTGSNNVASTGLVFTAGAAAGTTVTAAPVITAGSLDGKTPWVITQVYPSGTNIGDTYVANPTVTLKDSIGVLSATLAFPTVTFTTVTANATPPTIAITSPAQSLTNLFALETATLNFTVTDLGMFDVTAVVDWGDQTTPTSILLTGSGLATGLAPAVTPTHQYTVPSTTPYTVTVTATDSQASGNTAGPQTRTFLVKANALPTATITTPQASGTLPSLLSDVTTFTPASMKGEMTLPPAANYPQVVVIPMNGQLRFNGTTTPSGSGETLQSVLWTFPGGNPGTATTADAGNVVFPGVANQIVAYLVEFQAFDVFGRNSSQVGQGLTGASMVAATGNTAPFRKWVIVDGTQTQNFYLNFLYRQKTDVLQSALPLTPVTTAANGLGAQVQIFQDGVTNTFAVQSGNVASVILPVRGNLPFWINIPAFGADKLGYTLEIPNAPTGPFMDPSLVAAATPPTAESASFTFAGTSFPYNPTLNLVTGQGYAAEGAAPDQVMFQGDLSLEGNNPSITTEPKTDRWISFLSVPATDSTATQVVLDNTTTNAFSGVPAFQSFPEWLLAVKTEEPDKLTASTVDTNSTAEGGNTDLGFNLLFGTYAGSSAVSKTFAAVGLEAFRVPAGQSDPYNLSFGTASWNASSCFTNLAPTQYTPLESFTNMVYSGPGSQALSGGLDGLSVPYDVNLPGGPVLATPMTRYQRQGLPVFSVAEYLWSSVWVRPQVLNVANVASPDVCLFFDDGSQTPLLDSFAFYRYSKQLTSSDPTSKDYLKTWPKYLNPAGITPDGSTFDLTVRGGPVFDAGIPVGTSATSTTPDAAAVGRFWWTAFNPKYNAPDGACIARTWLASDATNLIPTTFKNQTTDLTVANNALGFLPPLDPVVDKRDRDANGLVIAGGGLGGYRITWFNPTKALDQKTCIPPDFWAVELTTSAGVNHFLLPASFPAAPTSGADTTQTLTSPLLTDARYYLPSYNPATGSPNTTKAPVDTVAPGYCWFDVPPELRPQSGTATIIIFALKSVMSNNAPAGAYPRPLNRTDWIDAIKTATATISVQPNAGKDLNYVYKVPFNYGWDIVVANCEATTVAP